MTNYLQIANDTNNVIQIADDFYNLALSQKTTIATNTTVASASGITSYTLSVSGATTPILAVRCASLCAVVQITKSGSTWNFLIYVYGAIGTNVTCYIFDAPVAVTRNSGLVLTSASGQVIFDSNYRYLKIVSFMANLAATTGPSASPPYGDVSYSYSGSSSRLYAAVFSRLSGAVRPGGNAGGFPFPPAAWCLGAKINGSGLDMATIFLGAAVTSATYTGNYNGAISVIDVTFM